MHACTVRLHCCCSASVCPPPSIDPQLAGKKQGGLHTGRYRTAAGLFCISIRTPHQTAELPFSPFACSQAGISPYGIFIPRRGHPPPEIVSVHPPHFQLAVFPFSSQVGIPPYGIVIDVGGFFWNEFMSMLAASILLSGQYGQFRCGVWGSVYMKV